MSHETTNCNYNTTGSHSSQCLRLLASRLTCPAPCIGLYHAYRYKRISNVIYLCISPTYLFPIIYSLKITNSPTSFTTRSIGLRAISITELCHDILKVSSHLILILILLTPIILLNKHDLSSLKSSALNLLILDLTVYTDTNET